MTQRDRLLELLDDYGGCDLSLCDVCDRPMDDCLACKNEQLAEYLLANGVVVPPCKFLQKCFVMPTIENNLSDITEMKCIGFSLSHDSYNANLITDKNKLYQPCFGAFGKTVFLTREEAERYLERRKNEIKNQSSIGAVQSREDNNARRRRGVSVDR